jgi:hypothetical protein
MTDPGRSPESAERQVVTDSLVIESGANGPQTFSHEQREHELKASSQAHRQQRELQRLESELSEAAKNKTFGRWLLGLAFGAGLLIVIGGIGVGFAMAVWANDPGTRDFGEQMALLLVGTVAGGWAGFFAGSKFG